MIESGLAIGIPVLLRPRHAGARGRFVTFAVESRGRTGRAALTFVHVSDLGDFASAFERISKGAFVRWAMKLLSDSKLLRRAAQRHPAGPGWCPLGSRAPGMMRGWMSQVSAPD